ncbi:type I-U CRISPR-associated RAMP protein Csb1/Cas7u [Azospirillum sp. B506]|uniref:type I-G CRISPR-associated RAMP protein Csb1/Cas7g n=1 Tax=Azospirillum sp. B506 TaxID=137721 RepID=UPI000346A3BB|nr:type I-U CRISPR-associated RAMP protein Csb1/Cas7u [Azospirillum sp. B506]
MDITTLTRMVAENAALRRRQTLQPVGGKNDKIFPPTYPGEGRNAQPTHAYEWRRIDGKDIACVLVDSPQSQANRLEEALLAAIRAGAARIPHVVVDFTGFNLTGLSELTSLDVPHRVYDAILRDSLLGKEAFMKSALGTRLIDAKAGDASALLETSPNALLFGSWHSTGQGGGLGAKFARCLVSEIVAIGVPIEEITNQRTGEVVARTAGVRTGSRIDPVGTLSSVKIYKAAADGEDWTPFIDKAKTEKGKPVLFTRKKGDKAGKPAVINHGNIRPSLQNLGITCDHLEHTVVISFAGLRRLRFGSPERDAAGRALLAALGVLAIVEQDAQGYALRSRCDLVCDGRVPLELVRPDGDAKTKIDIDRDGARALYRDAVTAALAAGFSLPEEPIRLVPQDKLVAMIRESERLAREGKGGEEDGEDDGAGS